MTLAMPRDRGSIRLNIGPPSTQASTIFELGNRALEHLFQHPRAAIGIVFEQEQTGPRRLIPDEVGKGAHLRRRNACEAVLGHNAGHRRFSSFSGSLFRWLVVSLARCLGCHRDCELLLALGPVAPERTGGGELSQLVSDH